MKQNVGVLGLGIIGSRVVENLRAAGHEVFVWSRSARAVPNFLASPREVAEAAGIIQIFVRDGAALLEAIEDMKPVLGAGHLVMNHATVSKKAALQAAALVEETGAAFLDAPFTGSKMAAQNGKLTYYIGGSDLMLERARPVLEASAAKILPLGAVGDAMVLKSSPTSSLPSSWKPSPKRRRSRGPTVCRWNVCTRRWRPMPTTPLSSA